MSRLSIGIVGLPNVGKSTLFQALTAVAVPAENYPFCTIDPNVGIVEVPDQRLHRLGDLAPRERRVPTVIEFLDIAGLVEGASRGEGLGNRFLSHVRDVDAIVHVVRFFEDPSVARADDQLEEEADPLRDREIVETELALADLETVEHALDKADRKARSGDRQAQALETVLRRVRGRLEVGQPARRESVDGQETRLLRSLSLLTMKPVLYVANLAEDQLAEEKRITGAFREMVRRDDPEAETIEIAARLEADLLELEPEERAEFLEGLDLAENGLARFIQAGYRLLGLHTFFTIGEEEVRAWTVRIGAKAPEAAGRVHTDFERGFIRAETIHFADFERMGSMREAREQGLVRSEGKDYVVQDGDILFFRAAG
jgi:GTP-binding protein YchF